MQPPEPETTHRIAPLATIDCALDYRRRGFCVIPVRPGKERRPHIKWKGHQQRLPTEDDICGWWHRWPNALIGIVCGSISGGMVVLDVDPRHKGDESIKGLHLPPTPTVRSGRGDGGFHYWLKTERPLQKRKNIVPGVDFQAEGSFVLAPPSIHQLTGKPYAWVEDLGLDDLPFAPIPAWIAEKVKALEALPDAPKVSSSITSEAFALLEEDPLCIRALEEGQAIKAGHRNLATLNLIGYLRSRGLPLQDAVPRAQAMIHRLPPSLSSTPLREQLSSVVGVAKSVYGSPDQNYLFHCAYVRAMGMPCAGPECPLFDVAGRASRLRKWVKVSDAGTPKAETGAPLEEVRRRLRDQLQAIADNPDGNFHVFRIEAGVGKTVAASEVLLPKGATYFTANHKQLETPQEIAERLGVNCCRFPKLDEENCVQHKVVRQQMAYGSNYVGIICPSCERRNNCDYLQAQRPGDKATSILLVSLYHGFQTFYDHHGNPRRQFIVFDEDPLPVLRPQRTLTPEGLTSYRRLLQQALDFDPDAPAPGQQLLLRPPGFSHPQPEAVRTNLQAQIDLVEALRAALEAGTPPTVPADLRARYVVAEADETQEWLYEFLKAEYRARKKVVEMTNLFRELHELLTDRARGLTLTHQGLSFHADYPPPPGKTIIVLDATAKAADFRGVVGDRKIIEHRLPPVTHDGHIYQLLDANWSRQSIAIDTSPQDLKGKEQSRPNRTLGKLLAAISRRHPGKSMGIITHMASQEHVRQQLPPGLGPRFGHYGAQRGSNDFVGVDVLVVIGSPKITPDAIRAKAVALCGHEVPEEEMAPAWREVRGRNGTFKVEVRGYRSPEMQAAYAHCVTNELLQALGRARYVHGGKIVYLITNEPVEGLGNIEFLTKRDLLGDRPSRADSRYQAVEDFVRARFSQGQPVSIQDVLAALPGTAQTTLSTHLSRAVRALGGFQQGRQWAPGPLGLS